MHPVSLALLAGVSVLAPVALSRTAAQAAILAPQNAGSTLIGPVGATQNIAFTVIVPYSNRSALDTLVSDLYNPKEPQYGRYLTAAQFQAKFGPAPADVQAILSFAKANGLTVSNISADQSIVHLTGPAGPVSKLFGTTLSNYKRSDGTTFRAASVAPTLPAALSSHAVGVMGLDTSLRGRPFLQRVDAGLTQLATPPSGATAAKVGLINRSVLLGAVAPTPNDPPDPNPLMGGYSLDPENVRSVYQFPQAKTSGSGQSTAVYEVGGFTPADITTFEKQYNLPSLSPTVVFVDGVDGAPGLAAAEATLDIDLELELAPNLSNIYVYEVPNEDGDFLGSIVDVFSQAASDDKASVLSVSYGLSETDISDANLGASYFEAVNQVLARMAAQGQTVCVSSGDAGAYTDQFIVQPNGTPIPNTSEPGSEPGVLSVGGTYLRTNPDQTYVNESSWGYPDDKGRGNIGTGGGGGISSEWAIPQYQIGAFDPSVNTQGSTTMRNVPDVSLFGDYDEGGYPIYLTDPDTGQGGWGVYNGTSASSPLWASFLANVNQARLAAGQPLLGLSQNTLYPISENPVKAPLDFHDIADGSTNLFYKAVPGYDDSTGIGSFSGANLLNDMVPAAAGAMAKLVSLTFDPGTSYVGGPANGTVVLSSPAPAGGQTVTISPSTAGSAPLVTVTVPANASSAVFALPSSATAATGTTTYTAASNNVSVSGKLTVTTLPKITEFALGVYTIPDTYDDDAEIVLSGVAPFNAAVVTFTQIGPNSTKPVSIGSIQVPSGLNDIVFGLPIANSQAFKYTPGLYQITATYNNSSVTVPLTVVDPQPTITDGSATPATLPGTGGNVSVSATLTDPIIAIYQAYATVVGSDGSEYFGALSSINANVYSGIVPVSANLTGSTITYTAVVTGEDERGFTNSVAVGTVTQAPSAAVVNDTGSLRITQGPAIYSAFTGNLSESVTITNTSKSALAGPLDLLALNPQNGWTFANSTGNVEGYPYVPVTSGPLAAGASVRVTMIFTGGFPNVVGASLQVVHPVSGS